MSAPPPYTIPLSPNPFAPLAISDEKTTDSQSIHYKHVDPEVYKSSLIPDTVPPRSTTSAPSGPDKPKPEATLVAPGSPMRSAPVRPPLPNWTAAGSWATSRHSDNAVPVSGDSVPKPSNNQASTPVSTTTPSAPASSDHGKIPGSRRAVAELRAKALAGSLAISNPSAPVSTSSFGLAPDSSGRQHDHPDYCPTSPDYTVTDPTPISEEKTSSVVPPTTRRFTVKELGPILPVPSSTPTVLPTQPSSTPSVPTSAPPPLSTFNDGLDPHVQPPVTVLAPGQAVVPVTRTPTPVRPPNRGASWPPPPPRNPGVPSGISGPPHIRSHADGSVGALASQQISDQSTPPHPRIRGQPTDRDSPANFTIHVNFTLTNELRDRLAVLYPGYNFLEAAGATPHSHPLLALERRFAEDVAYNLLPAVVTDSWIVDIGGNAARHAAAGRRIWSCCPNLSPEDVVRNAQRVGFPHQCPHLFQECHCVPPSSYLSIHSLYYLSLQDVLTAVVRARTGILVAAVHRFTSAVGSFYNGEAHYMVDNQGFVHMQTNGNLAPYYHSVMPWLQARYYSDETNAVAWNIVRSVHNCDIIMFARAPIGIAATPKSTFIDRKSVV